jgi:hypothetical protein
VTEAPWVSADGAIVRFYLAAMGKSWVSFEGFTLDPHRHKTGFAARGVVPV